LSDVHVVPQSDRVTVRGPFTAVGRI